MAGKSKANFLLLGFAAYPTLHFKRLIFKVKNGFFKMNF